MLDLIVITAMAAPQQNLPTQPCLTEDSVNCVWDARHMGNGKGRSFYVKKNGKKVFVTHRRAHHMLRDFGC